VGGGSIGGAVAREFAREGAHVFIGDKIDILLEVEAALTD